MAGRGGLRSTSWKKGQSGNPGGRPKIGVSVTKLVAEALEHKITARGIDGKEKKAKVVEFLAEIIVARALKGDIPMIKAIWDRIDGLPVQKIGFNGTEGEITVKYKAVPSLGDKEDDK